MSGPDGNAADGKGDNEPPRQQMEHLGVMVPRGLKGEVRRVAHEKSDPAGDRVEVSNVVREALRDYLARYNRDPDSCDPATRGEPEVAD